MTSSLFRSEALEHRKDRLYGEVLLLQPLSLTLLVAAVVLICLLILSILCWGTYARKETVHGYLLPDKGIVKSYAPQTGTVNKVYVHEGDEVTEGQTLMSVVSERVTQGGRDVDSLQLQEIESTLAHQQARIISESALEVAQKNQFQSQITGIEKELVQIEENIIAQQDRVKMIANRVAALKPLMDNKNLSQIDYQKIVDEHLAQKQKYQELLSVKATKENALFYAQSELAQLPLKAQAKIHELENSISELKQRQAEMQGRRGVDIRAPLAGVIAAVHLHEGQKTDINTPLLAIIPKNALLQAELFLPSRAIGFIHEGQAVKIRYDAFPYRRFGIYEGTVMVISKHVLLPAELPIPVYDLKEPVYRISVQLKQQYVVAYGKDFPLQAGISLEADIILERQTLFKWILDPLLSLRGRM